jgi:hypothetical protein
MKKSMLVVTGLILISFLLGGCFRPGAPTPTSQVDLLNTAAAQTIQAQQSHIAQTSQAQYPEGTPTATVQPTVNPNEPTATPIPNTTDSPRFTPTGTLEDEACNRAAFVSETIPDGTTFLPGETFTKTWKLSNDGECTWNANYDLVFVTGDAMDAPASKPLTSEPIEPGQVVEISVDLQAPSEIGSYRGDFKLRNENGVIFGIGNTAEPFWVEIDVESTPIAGSIYDFTNKYCSSGVTWSNGAGNLPCPGKSGDSGGWVRRVDKPTLETGAVDDEPGLQVHPQKVNNGWIKGVYPEITFTSDAYFRAIIGCYGAANCDVRFKLNAIVDGGSELNLGTWHEVQDGEFRRVELDISQYKNRRISFILIVEAIGQSADNTALWFAPRLEP